jgi:hypothetical protein
MATYYDIADFYVGNMDIAIDIIKGSVNDLQGYLESTTTVEDQVALLSHLSWSDDKQEGKDNLFASEDNDRKMPAVNGNKSDLSDDNENDRSSTFNNIENDDVPTINETIDSDDVPTINESIEEEKFTN